VRHIPAEIRLCIRRWRQRDPDWVTPSVATLEFVAAGITIDRLGGYQRVAARKEDDDVLRSLISGFSQRDWSLVERLVSETVTNAERPAATLWTSMTRTPCRRGSN
jgi:hypothetical protein